MNIQIRHGWTLRGQRRFKAHGFSWTDALNVHQVRRCRFAEPQFRAFITVSNEPWHSGTKTRGQRTLSRQERNAIISVQNALLRV